MTWRTWRPLESKEIRSGKSATWGDTSDKSRFHSEQNLSGALLGPTSIFCWARQVSIKESTEKRGGVLKEGNVTFPKLLKSFLDLMHRVHYTWKKEMQIALRWIVGFTYPADNPDESLFSCSFILLDTCTWTLLQWWTGEGIGIRVEIPSHQKLFKPVGVFQVELRVQEQHWSLASSQWSPIMSLHKFLYSLNAHLSWREIYIKKILDEERLVSWSDIKWECCSARMSCVAWRTIRLAQWNEVFTFQQNNLKKALCF